MKPAFPYAVLAFAALVADQAVKAWAEVSLPFEQAVAIVPYVSLYRTWNIGISFSFLGGTGPTALAALSAAVMVFVLWLAMKTAPTDRFARAGFALILAGAAGNLIDRLRFGHVVDYMLVHTESWAFAVFNLADACITVGAGLVLLQEAIAWRAGRNSRSQTPKAD
ncbi:MAG: signal peptidase II [Rhizobiaceae bacterium]